MSRNAETLSSCTPTRILTQCALPAASRTKDRHQTLSARHHDPGQHLGDTRSIQNGLRALTFPVLRVVHPVVVVVAIPVLAPAPVREKQLLCLPRVAVDAVQLALATKHAPALAPEVGDVKPAEGS